MRVTLIFTNVECGILNQHLGNFINYIYGVKVSETVTRKKFGESLVNYEMDVDDHNEIRDVKINMNNGGSIIVRTPKPILPRTVYEKDLPLSKRKEAEPEYTLIYDEILEHAYQRYQSLSEEAQIRAASAADLTWTWTGTPTASNSTYTIDTDTS